MILINRLISFSIITAANLDLPYILNDLESKELPSTSTQCTSTSFDPNQVVNEDLNDEDGNIPVGRITVMSQNAEKIIITLKKSNRKQRKIERVYKNRIKIIDLKLK